MKIFKSALTTFNVWNTCQRYTLSKITPSNDKGLHCNMQHAKGRLEPHFYYINLNYDFPYKCYFLRIILLLQTNYILQNVQNWNNTKWFWLNEGTITFGFYPILPRDALWTWVLCITDRWWLYLLHVLVSRVLSLYYTLWCTIM